MDTRQPIPWHRHVLIWWSDITRVYASTVVVLVLLTSGLSLWYTSLHLGFLTDRNDLIAGDKVYLQLDEAYAKTFLIDQLVVAAEGPDRATTQRFVRALGERLQADQHYIQDVIYQIDTSSLAGKKLLLLSPDELRTLRHNVEEYQDLIQEITTTPGLTPLLTALNRKIAEAMASHLAEGFFGLSEPEDPDEAQESAQPFDLSFLKTLLQQMVAAVGGILGAYRSPWDDFLGNAALSSQGFLVSDDDALFYLLVELRSANLESGPESEFDFDTTREAIRAIRQHIATLQQTFPQVQAGVTGDDALGNDEMVAAQADTETATVLALVGVTLLYVVFFRSLGRPVLIAVTVIIGLIWTAGMVALTIGHVSILSIYVAPILVGLCDAYGVYLITRYEEERDLGRPFAVALQTTFVMTTPGLVGGAGTTAVAFYAMTLADFRGVQELGWIAGTGVLLLLLAALTVLPAFLTLTEGRRPWQQSVRRTSLVGRGFLSWGQTIQRFRGPLLARAVVLSVACLCVVPTLSFDYNLLRLQAHNTESVTWELRILAQAGRSARFALATAPSLTEAAETAARFAALPTVEYVETITTLVPEQQAERLAVVRSLAPLFTDLSRAVPTPKHIVPEPIAIDELKPVLDSMRFKLRGEDEEWPAGTQPPAQDMADVRRLMSQLLTMLETVPAAQAIVALERLQKSVFEDFATLWALLRRNLAPSGPITLTDIPASLRSRFVGQVEQGGQDGTLFLLHIYPRHNIWEWEPLRAFVTQLRQVDPDVTGNPVVSYESIRAIKDGYITGGLYAAAAIPLLAFLVLRRVPDTVLALLPVGCGLLWTVGLMWLCNLSFNLANLIVIPLLIGVGVDGGINLIRRAREEPHEGWQLVGSSTGQTIALYSLDSMVGFGSLMVARHYGVFSMGLLLTLAVASVLVATLTILPLLLHAPASGQECSRLA